MQKLLRDLAILLLIIIGDNVVVDDDESDDSLNVSSIELETFNKVRKRHVHHQDQTEEANLRDRER